MLTGQLAAKSRKRRLGDTCTGKFHLPEQPGEADIQEKHKQCLPSAFHNVVAERTN